MKQKILPLLLNYRTHVFFWLMMLTILLLSEDSGRLGLFFLTKLGAVLCAALNIKLMNYWDKRGKLKEFNAMFAEPIFNEGEHENKHEDQTNE